MDVQRTRPYFCRASAAETFTPRSLNERHCHIDEGCGDGDHRHEGNSDGKSDRIKAKIAALRSSITAILGPWSMFYLRPCLTQPLNGCPVKAHGFRVNPSTSDVRNSRDTFNHQKNCCKLDQNQLICKPFFYIKGAIRNSSGN